MRHEKNEAGRGRREIREDRRKERKQGGRREQYGARKGGKE